MKKAIILAAGEGTRMKSDMPKVLHEILGVSMIEIVINELKKANIEEIIAIVGNKKELVIEKINSIDENIKCVEQPLGNDVPYGTGFAVSCASDELDNDDHVLVVCGDTPLLRGESLEKLIHYNIDNNISATVLTATVNNPFGYGRIVTDEGGFIKKIVEEKDADENEKLINEINSGVYIFSGKSLLENLSNLDTNNSQGELYLTDIIEILNNKGEKIGKYNVEDSSEILGVNSRIQLVDSERILKTRINERLLSEGVTIFDKENTAIGPNVKIGRDTKIYPGVRILGDTEIGENNILEGDTRVENSIIGNNNWIKSSYIENSTIDDGVTMGPYAHIRPNSTIKTGAHIGNFVEIKKSTFGENSKAGHLAYIGDSEVGRDVNIGCGVITVNYDGVNKNKTVIGDNAFIGSNSNLIAPVNVSDSAFVAAGSTITDDVDSYDLAIERGEQKNIKGWVMRKKLK